MFFFYIIFKQVIFNKFGPKNRRINLLEIEILTNFGSDLMDIEKIINNWDPYSLFPYVPTDEYSYEIEEIKKYIRVNHYLDDLIIYLEKIFDSEIIFGEEKINFTKIANKILDSSH